MFWIIAIALLFGGLIYYLLTLDFEIGTGFSEEKRKAKEVKYTTEIKDVKKIGPE